MEESNLQLDISNYEYWVKVVEMLQQNWAVIVKEDCKYRTYFFDDGSKIFDQIDYQHREDAEHELSINGFEKWSVEDFEFIDKPKSPVKFALKERNIYSSGKYWKKRRFNKEYLIWNEDDLTYNVAKYSFSSEKEKEDYWRIVEDEYLMKYKELVRLEFEWSSNGLWRIPFPGSLGYGENCSYSFLNLSTDTINLLKKWMHHIDSEIGVGKIRTANWDQLNSWGLVVAKKIVQDMPKDYYFEFPAFRQIVVKDNHVVQLDINERLKRYLVI